MILKVKAILEENLKEVTSNTTFNGCWKIADLGCSSGPNALMVVSNILNIIDNISLRLNHGPPIFQIYLNDLFENDFNTIFKLLPDFYRSIQEERGDKVGACFINATPGSFYGRLFPNNYINLFHSSYCIHWLSQVNTTKPTFKSYYDMDILLWNNRVLIVPSILFMICFDFNIFFYLF